MDVTDLLRDRSHESAGFQRMMTLSIAVHVLFFAAFFVAPGAWLSQRASQEPPTVMTISLNGGGDEPRNGGLTAMGGRPVQVQTPPEEAKRPEAVRPPAAKAPEMTLPTPGARVGETLVGGRETGARTTHGGGRRPKAPKPAREARRR